MSELSSKIEETAKELNAALEKDPNHPNILSLRDLGRYCNKYTLESNNPFERFVSFILGKYLEDLILNLNVDAYYSLQLHQARLKIYTQLNESLRSIGNNLPIDETLNIVKSLTNIIDNYVDQVNFINNNTNPK